MYSYENLNEALTGLKQRGYTEDFNLDAYCLDCPSLSLRLHPEDFTIDEYYRFEGDSNPDDSSIIYAISSTSGVKGILVDAYGMYAANLSEEMIRKLKVSHEQ